MANRGRPTKLNKKVQEEIIRILRLGNSKDTAAAFAGIDRATLYTWIKRGKQELIRVEVGSGKKIRKSEDSYVEFYRAVEKAMAEAEIREVQNGQGDRDMSGKRN